MSRFSIKLLTFIRTFYLFLINIQNNFTQYCSFDIYQLQYGPIKIKKVIRKKFNSWVANTVMPEK